MAAACGDDDGDGDGGGGSGGQGGSGGSAGVGGTGGGGAGNAGEAGSGPSGGAAGQPTAGAGGTSGAAGTSGGSAGSGQAGAGVVDPGDAGPDGSVEADASVPPDGGSGEVADSGVNGDCAGFTTSLGSIDPQNSQDVVIARVIFNDDGETATAVLRVINPFSFGGDQKLCWGATNSECAAVDDDVIGDRIAGTEVAVVVGTAVDPIEVAEGELLFAAENPENDPAVFAYVNWNDHVSADVDGVGILPSLEGFADNANFWTLGESIDLTGDENAFFGSGDTSLASGFGVCTADQF